MARNQQSVKRKRNGEQGGGGSRKRQWRSDTNWSGHGIFMTCPRGKERKAANELIEILIDTARSLYPALDLSKLPLPPKQLSKLDSAYHIEEEEDEDDMRNGLPLPPVSKTTDKVSSAPTDLQEYQADATLASSSKLDSEGSAQQVLLPPTTKKSSIEDELKAELADLKEADSKTYGKRPLHQIKASQGGKDVVDEVETAPSFRLMETGTECLVFIGVHHLLDPFELCDTFLEQVAQTGEARSRIISRLSPIAGLCPANPQNLGLFARQVLPRYFPETESGTFKIDPRIRSHNTLSRTEVIDIVARSIPRPAGTNSTGWRADLKNADKWIIVEVHKAQAGIGVLSNYTRFCKMNPLELANSIKTKMLKDQDGGTYGDGIVGVSSNARSAKEGKRIEASETSNLASAAEEEA